ncbi:hypothetical protein HAX54_021850, partial [Datura stramonium]|nr:hypothetical protein [Datura stramonium]
MTKRNEITCRKSSFWSSVVVPVVFDGPRLIFSKKTTARTQLPKLMEVVYGDWPEQWRCVTDVTPTSGGL